jgi:hypothetical protein
MTHGDCVGPLQSQTVMIAMLTVMSGMDSHMISGNLGWFGLVGLVLLVRSILHSGLCGVIDVLLLRF